ncbi:MAG: redoxin family protein [Candidatus Hydrogenedentes bacterium]|nr:redoxin family protein [Candidatus Hydrogenedentota bacterium]
MARTRRIAAVALLLWPAWLAGSAEPAALPLHDLYYETVTLEQFPAARARVLFFFSNTCPVARRYMPRIGELEARYRERGVQFIAINASPADNLREIAQHARDFGLDFTVLKDHDFALVRALDITRTPEVVVLDAGGAIAYRGRVDDQYRLGGVRPTASRHDLANALDDLLAGRPVREPRTQAEGCAVTFPMLPAPATPPTYHQDVRPILDRHCTACHTGGGPAPMPLDSLEAVRDAGDRLLRVIQADRMPPWNAAGEMEHLAMDRLSFRDRHAIENWLRGEQRVGEGPAETLDPAPLAPSDYFSAREGVPAEDRDRTVSRTLDPPAETERWITSIAVRGEYPLGFTGAALFYTLPGDPEARHRLTGPILAGRSLQWHGGEGMRLPAGARLHLEAHYAARSGVQGEDYPGVLLGTAPAPGARAIACIALDIGAAESPTADLADLRAIAFAGPARGAFELTANGGEGPALLSLPAFDPRWPLTYAVRPNILPDGPAPLTATFAQPGYLYAPGATPDPGAAGTVYLYVAGAP